MKIKYSAAVAIGINCITYSAEKLGLCPPPTDRFTFQNYRDLPFPMNFDHELEFRGVRYLEEKNPERVKVYEELSHKAKLDSFESNVVKFLCGSFKSNTQYKKDISESGNVIRLYQCEYVFKKNIYQAEYYIIKANSFFWEKKAFNTLEGFEKQLAEHYNANSESNIEIFYALSEDLIKTKTNLEIFSQGYSSINDRINHIWGIKVNGEKYCNTWILEDKYGYKSEVFMDSNQTIIAKKTDDGTINFIKK